LSVKGSTMTVEPFTHLTPQISWVDPARLGV
jgi:hypothetical protein